MTDKGQDRETNDQTEAAPHVRKPILSVKPA
jgi:hypothetical protein